MNIKGLLPVVAIMLVMLAILGGCTKTISQPKVPEAPTPTPYVFSCPAPTSGTSKLKVVVCSTTGVVRTLHDGSSAAGDLVTDIILTSSTIVPGSGVGSVWEIYVQLTNGMSIQWTGNDQNGVFVPEGLYKVYVCSSDGLGGNNVFVRNVTVLAP